MLFTAKITSSSSVEIVELEGKRFFSSVENAVAAAEAQTGLHFAKSASAFIEGREYRAAGLLLTVEEYYIPSVEEIA